MKFSEAELAYQNILIEFGRRGIGKRVALTLSVKRRADVFLAIPEGDYRFESLESDDKYGLVNIYSWNSLPNLKEVKDDIKAFRADYA